ncbi:hypothetical protein A6A19_00250 [Actinobacillus delphinicola]|uniref:hypothetical protein n=1 Tax=Actinobacillus delphinicola TaxID=51161 RepID=UPI002441B86C|nr:hypothetical protein [Actinobacillus delphinicola]MDG6896476.1 hypothetical protein [Actinobacillus delphinicola]
MATSTQEKIAKLQLKLDKAIAQKEKIEKNISILKEKLDTLKNKEKLDIVTKLVNNKDTLKTMLDLGVISKEDFDIIS